MNCVWPSAKPAKSQTWALAVLLLMGSACAGWSAVEPPSSLSSYDSSDRLSLAQREKLLHRVPAHISEFSPVSAPLDLPRCGDIRPPEALLTPDPPVEVQQDQLHVRVSFIVGTDGHVHSAFVLDSGGADEDQVVLRAVSSWRYRPALCNGVPTDSEALVRFSIR